MLFYYSPIKFFEIFLIEIPDDWFKVVQNDTFIAPLYIIAKSFSAMILTSGLAMILPLYDPLKYRGLIYFTGILFPILSVVVLFYNGIKFEHWILTFLGIIFLVILLAVMCGLIITRKEAKAGIE
jgi:hypothetical protein